MNDVKHHHFSFGPVWGGFSHAPGRLWLCDLAVQRVFHLVWTIRPTRFAHLYWRGKLVYAAKPYRDSPSIDHAAA